MYGTYVNEKTKRKYFSTNQMGEVPCYGGGKNASIPKRILSALDSAVISYIQLSNAGLKAQPNRPAIITKMQAYLRKGGFVFAHGGVIRDKMMTWHADKLVVNTDNNVVEQRRLKWTMYANINVWFETLKGFLIEFGCAWESTKQLLLTVALADWIWRC